MKVTPLLQLPVASLLEPYQKRLAYTDAYSLDLKRPVGLSDFIEAFYTTGLFKLERLILATLVAKPSTDAQARALALGVSTKFAAWTVESRTDNQIVMCDYLNKTRSWLMCVPQGAESTRLYFGSAIVPDRILPNGEAHLGTGFHLLVPFHKVYSRALLGAAAHRLP